MNAVRCSLRTNDPSEAKRRQANAAAYAETVWRGLREDQPVALTNREATALAGRLYRAWALGEGRERTSAAAYSRETGWQSDEITPEEQEAAFAAAVVRLKESAESQLELETSLGRLVDRLLLSEGIAAVDAASRSTLLTAFYKALVQALELRERNAAGDYLPDPYADRFPEWKPRIEDRAAALPRAGFVSLSALVEEWWKEAQASGRKPSTYESYRNTMARFVAFLKHDDARRVTPADIVAFKDHRLASTHRGRRVSAKTVKDSDLAGLKTIFAWAVANRKLPSNPAEGVTIKIGKRVKLRAKGFSDEEAQALLSAASRYAGTKKEQRRTVAAKRWVPWLCAYNGSRVGEMAQLRKDDMRREGTVWVLRITPEAGTVKTNEARDAVLHSHLIEQGFPDFVQAAPPGHLFLRPGAKGEVRGPLRGLKNRLAEFARSVVRDPNVAPNHGWRHRFKTIGMEAGIDHRILDAIQGQTPRSVSETYGEVTVKTMAIAMEKVPRIPVG
jgi:integrase